MNFIILQLRGEELDAKKITTVKEATYAVAKRRPEKFTLGGIRTLKKKRRNALTSWVGNPGLQANRLLSIILISNPACRTHVIFTRFTAVRKSTEKSAARVTLKGRDKKKITPP